MKLEIKPPCAFDQLDSRLLFHLPNRATGRNIKNTQLSDSGPPNPFARAWRKGWNPPSLCSLASSHAIFQRSVYRL